jgi:hypothetical protein
MSTKVLSSDPNEHSTPLSDNKGRRGTNVPLLSSVDDNAADNDAAELSAPRQPSPIVSQGLQLFVLPQKRVLVKSPSAQSSSPTTSFSKYTRRPSLAFQQQQQEQEQDGHHQASQLPPSPGTLARHGIKVRDFAYESNLPLIPSIPRARRGALGVRPLKRTKRYFERPDDVFTLDTHSQSQGVGLSQALSLENLSVVNKRPLERKSTEPAIIPEEREPQRPYRDVGYADLSQHPSGSQATQRSLRYTLTPTSPTAAAATRTASTTFFPVSLPFPFPATKRLSGGLSQESELSTDTPLVTPKGSLTWPTITSEVPASQLDNNNSSQPSAFVQDTMPTYSQLGFSPPFSQAPDSHHHNAALGSPPPATEPPLDNPDDNARASSPPSPSPTRRTRTTRPLTDSSPPRTPHAGPRYFLRKHGSPGQDRESPPSLHRRRKSPAKAPAPYPRRVPPVTRQSAHAVSSDSSGRSPRARPLRKSTMS